MKLRLAMNYLLTITWILSLTSVVFLETEAREHYNFTNSKWDVPFYNPFILKLGSRLLAVFRTEDSIILQSKDPNFKHCEIPIGPDRFHMSNRLIADVLGNSKIVALGIRYPKFHFTMNTVNYIIYVIDPQTCTFKTAETPSDHVQYTWPRVFGALVTYHDTFDIFFANHKSCSPCRYNDEAEEMELEYSLDEENEGYGGFGIGTIKKNDPSEGYFYFCSYTNHTAIMKLLNSRFQAVKQEFVNHPVNTYSVSTGAEIHIGICYSTPNVLPEPNQPHQQRVTCNLLDGKLQLRSSTPMYITNENFYSFPSIQILRDGAAWVAVAHAKPDHKHGWRFPEAEILVQRLSANGLPSKPIEFQKMNGHLFDMRPIVLGDQYCLTIVNEREQALDYADAEINAWVKCVHI